MKTFAAAAVLLLFAMPVVAQQATPPPVAPAAPATATPAAPLPYGVPITLEQAKKAMAAAEGEAQKNNWPVAISIIDSGGHEVLFTKLDNTQHGSIRIAKGKATTAVDLRRPSKAVEDVLAAGGAGLRFLSVPGVMALEGGVLIVSDGKIIGGIGVSGVTSAQDAQVARAGADAAK
jgi:glc operon protein GlcG